MTAPLSVARQADILRRRAKCGGTSSDADVTRRRRWITSGAGRATSIVFEATAGASMTNKIDLAGRNAVVTGGAQGIGRAIVERFLDSGAAVAIWDRDRALAEKTAA